MLAFCRSISVSTGGSSDGDEAMLAFSRSISVFTATDSDYFGFQYFLISAIIGTFVKKGSDDDIIM